MGNKQCRQCGNQIPKKSVPKPDKTWLKENELYPVCHGCSNANYKCQSCSKMTKDLYESYHIYPMKRAQCLKRCLFCGFDMNVYNNRYGKRYNGK